MASLGLPVGFAHSYRAPYSCCKGIVLQLTDSKIMTDSIKTILSLAKLSELVRMDVPAKICNVCTPHGEATERYTKPSRQPSALVDTDTKWLVRCVLGTAELEGSLVPSSIEANLNIPNALTGQNVVHGTSVFAAGTAALYLQKIWLAKAGIPREWLDLLETTDVKLNGTTITYTFPFTNHESAGNLVDAMMATGKVLFGKDCLSWHSGNDTVVIPGRDFTIVAYIKSDFSHCEWVDGAPVASIKAAAEHIVRVEVKLGLPFLRKRGLTSLESWRDAYARGIYEQVFDDTVRKSLRLTGERLRHKAPRVEVFALLTPTEAQVLRGYLAKSPIDPRESKTVLESASPSKRYYELRKPILDQARIDINIPWTEHVKLRCFELEDTLLYPGDFHPTAGHAAWSFCEANWGTLLERLKGAYEDALTAADAKVALPM
jgi:hypothetical protein